MKDDDQGESIVHINEHELDKECVRMPNQYRQAAWQAAETQRDIDELKAELEVVSAELHLKIRAKPEDFGIEKISEAAIKEAACIQAPIRKLSAELRKLEHRMELENVLVKAIDKKRSSLGNLVDLHCAGYRAEVKPTAEGREALREISKTRVSPPMSRTELMKKKERRQED